MARISNGLSREGNTTAVLAGAPAPITGYAMTPRGSKPNIDGHCIEPALKRALPGMIPSSACLDF